MFIRIVWMVKLLVICQFIGRSRQSDPIPPNPCPDLFQYYEGDDGEIYGELELPAIREDVTNITVIMSIRGPISDDNIGRLLVGNPSNDIQARQMADEPLVVEIRFPLPQGSIPRLVQVIYNNRLMCSGSKDIASPAHPLVCNIRLQSVGNTKSAGGKNQQDNGFATSGTINQQTPGTLPDLDYSPPTVVRREPEYKPTPHRPRHIPPSITSPVREPTTQTNNCGMRSSDMGISPLIVGGKKTRRDEWPWLAAIYVNQPTGLIFNCGGSLVSSRAVVTAAHCLKDRKKTYLPQEVIVYLGRYSLTNWHEAGSIQSEIASIFVHTDYQQQEGSFDADIAILILKEDVRFTERVRPICLWWGERDFEELDGLNGTVVGWGMYGVDKIISNVPKKIDLPIVDALTCIQKSRSLTQAVSSRTFCAGTLAGDGPCRGDSGGGLMLNQDGRWTLRGIVSSGKGNKNTLACDLEEYIVFTDVASFAEWILNHIRS